MFDVIWADPDRELIGEHRAKKEKRRQDKDKQKRSSLSTSRTSFSSTESPFSFLRSHGLKRINTSDTHSKRKSNSSAKLISPRCPSTTPSSIETKTRPNSDLSSIYSAPKSTSSAPQICKLRIEKPEKGVEEVSPVLSRHDSIFSKYSESDVRRSISIGEDSSDQEHTKTELITRPPPKHLVFPPPADRIRFQNKSLQLLWQPKAMGSPKRAHCKSNPGDKPALPPGPLPSGVSYRLKLQDPSQWKSRDEWIKSEQCSKSVSRLQENPKPAILLNPTSSCTFLDETAWKKEIDCKSGQNLEQICLCLRKLDAKLPDLQKDEADIERHKWVLWSLNHLDPRPADDTSKTSASRVAADDIAVCLTLHEPSIVTSYLSALHPLRQIIHLTTCPSPIKLSTKVQQLSVPRTCPSAIPVNDSRFDVIYSHRLPSLYPAAHIPNALSHIHSLLRPGGFFRLVLINPLPRACTMGPYMRHWLKVNLLDNLKKESRCIYPSRFVYQWFQDANLRGHGSVMDTTRLYAIFERSTLPSTVIDQHRADNLTKAEIRSYIGRWLWKEVWGQYVTDQKVWWDDPICRQECLDLGTVWEYYTIEGVKPADSRLEHN